MARVPRGGFGRSVSPLLRPESATLLPRYPRIQFLAEALRTELNNRYNDRADVALVCHSLGGLIARKYLVDEVMNRRPLRVKKLLLYAVPNCGSGLANVAEHISWRHGQLAQLARKSDFLDDLNRNWAALGLSDKVGVRYVLALQDSVVDEQSARAFPGNPDVDVVDDRGHINLVKPRSQDDIVYLIFRNFMAVPRIPPRSSHIAKVLVTRFQSVGEHGDNDAFANGLTDRLIQNLTNLDGVDPVPRVAMTRRSDRSPTELAEDFNAAYLVEGHFERLPDSDRCTVRSSLVELEKSQLRSVWGDTYERPWCDVQAVLVEVAAKIARHVKHTVGQKELLRLEDAPIRPVAAWEAFMKGSWLVEEFNNGHKSWHFDEAERRLKKALDLDGNYPEALEQLGFLYLTAWEVLGRPALLSESRRAWETLLGLDPANAFALAELGYLALVDGDEGREAARSARKAVESDPEHTIAHNVLALIYLYLGYYESQYKITRDEVLRRDPYYIYPYTNSALSLQLMKCHGEALEVAREARRVDRYAMVAVLLEGAQHYHRGALADAARVWSKGLENCTDRTDRAILNTALGWVLADEGDEAGARERIQRHRHERWVGGGYGPYFISLCSLAGERELALELLERATTHARSYRYLVSDKTLRPIAGDAGFRHLLERRYEVWDRNLRELEPGLPAKPRRVPTPDEFLRGLRSDETTPR